MVYTNYDVFVEEKKYNVVFEEYTKCLLLLSIFFSQRETAEGLFFLVILKFIFNILRARENYCYNMVGWGT